MNGLEKLEKVLKVGDRVKGMDGGVPFWGTVRKITGINSGDILRDDGKNGSGPHVPGYGNAWVFDDLKIYDLELIDQAKPDEEKTMSAETCKSDGIPKTLTVMERIKASSNDKVLIKAGYIEKGEYTQKAKDLAIVLFLEEQKAKLVEIATEELSEVAE